MWHEARKQERRIRGMIVDYRKRAERRQDFYERIQADPTQFIQIHGRRCKIHLDPAVAAAGDGAAIIVPWQGHQDNLIDRFDVRAHLDYIPPVAKQTDTDNTDITPDERQCNYERYRILAQNDFLNVTEEKFLHQLYLEEQFGANAQLEAERTLSKKKQHKSGATIGYLYEDTESSIGPQPFSHLMNVAIQSTTPTSTQTTKSEKEGSDSDSESDIDMDVALEVSKLDTAQAHELNACGRNYGMLSNDFYSFLTKDADEAEAMRMAREEEQEKMLLSGRKSRRERRAQKERRIACRPFSPPSYAAKEDAGGGKKENEDDSDSRSPSPADANTGKITYITSFGGEDELQPHSKISINISKGGAAQKGATLGAACAGTLAATATGGHTYAQKVKENLEKLKQFDEKTTTTRRRKSYERLTSRSRSRRRSHKKSYSRSRSSSRGRTRYSERSRTKHSRRRSRSCSNSSIGKIKRRKVRSRTRSKTPQSRRHRYSYSSTSSSTTSSSSSSTSKHRKLRKKLRHSRTRSRSRSKQLSPKFGPKPRAQARETVKEVPVVVKPSISTTKSTTITTATTTTTTTASVISYPLPLRTSCIDVSAPPPPLSTTLSASTTSSALVNPKLTDVVSALQVAPPPPLKRYYGRKRANDTSDSELESDVEHLTQQQESIIKNPISFGNEDIDERMDVDTTSDRSNPLPVVTTSTYSETQLTTQPQTGKYSVTPANNPSFSNASETKGGAINISSSASTSNQGRLNLRERLKKKMQNLLNKQYKADKRAEIEKTERERQLQQEREDEMRELALKLRRRQRELRHKYGTPNSSKGSESDVSDAVIASSASVTEQLHKLRRSKSRSIERVSVIPTTASIIQSTEAKRSRERENLLDHRLQPYRRSGSREHYGRDRDRNRDRERKHSRSRSRSHYKKQRRSRSRSRVRRSASRRRHRSPSRSRRVRDSSYERSTRYGGGDRNRRSRSRIERSSYRDRHDRDRERERDRDWRERERDRDRDRDKDRNRDQRGGGSSSSTVATATGSRNRIVISAPPKLKKLVDY